MVKRILVPLDTTVESETVLPLIADTARGAGATVRLLHVAPPPRRVIGDDGHVVAYADQESARLEAEALGYLDGVAPLLGGVAVERSVRFGDPVEEIVAEADESDAATIALTAGYHRSLGRVLRGGTARRVSRRTTRPVLVVRQPVWAAS